MQTNIAMWASLLCGIIVCGIWHTRENQKLSKQWHTDLDAFSARWLTRFAWSRTLQLLLALIACVVIIIAYTSQLNKTRTALADAQAQLAKPATPRDSPAVAATPAYYPPANTPAVAAPNAAAATPLAPVTAKSTVADIYNPEETTVSTTSQLDAMKKRYENLIVTYLFLNKCKKTGAQDYPIIVAALAQEMASANAPGRLQYEIQTAAQGSYKEMYTNTKCDTAGIEALAAQYQDYITRLSAQSALPATQ